MITSWLRTCIVMRLDRLAQHSIQLIKRMASQCGAFTGQVLGGSSHTTSCVRFAGAISESFMMEIPQVGPVANVGKRPRDSDTPFDRGPKGPSVEELIASEVLTAMAKDGAAAQTASGWMSQALAPSAFPPEAGLQTHKMQPLAAALQQQVLTPHQARLPQWSRPEVVLPGVQNQGNIVRSQTPAKLPPPRPAPISLAPSPSTQVRNMLQSSERLKESVHPSSGAQAIRALQALIDSCQIAK
jgi:hypothetical protein